MSIFRGLIAVSTLTLVVAMSSPAHAVMSTPAPGIINGISNPPLGKAAVAIYIGSTEDYYGTLCTGSLWRPRIVITTAHCFKVDDVVNIDQRIDIWRPAANTWGPASPVQVTQVIWDETYNDFPEGSTRSTERDIAFLILDRPLAQPV